MHKAVAARLREPGLTLYQALIIGGFNYQSDNEPTSVDEENVTLVQRKNQLSRRIRMAKRSNPKWQDAAQKLSSKAKMSSPMLTESITTTDNDSVKSRGSDARANAKLSPRHAVQAAQATVDDLQLEPLEPLEAESSCDALMYLEQLASSYQDAIDDHAGQPVDCNTDERLLLEPDHDYDGSMMANGPENRQLVHYNPQLETSVVSSLQSSAAACGLSLNDLAANLSGRDDITSWPQVDTDDANDNLAVDRNTLAMHLFHSEARMMYQTCMLRAGYTPEEVQDTSPQLYEFALEAIDNKIEELKQRIQEQEEASLQDRSGRGSPS
jgi:hypothetical protein